VVKVTRKLLEFDKNSVPIFDKLKKALQGKNGDLSNPEAFLIAMAWGVHYKVRPESIKRSGTGARLEYLTDSDSALLAAAHFAYTGTTDSLLDVNETHNSAELYAEGGIRLISEALDKPGSFSESFAATVFDIVETLGPLEQEDD
jgi:hypothetical protein